MPSHLAWLVRPSTPLFPPFYGPFVRCYPPCHAISAEGADLMDGLFSVFMSGCRVVRTRRPYQMMLSILTVCIRVCIGHSVCLVFSMNFFCICFIEFCILVCDNNTAKQHMFGSFLRGPPLVRARNFVLSAMVDLYFIYSLFSCQGFECRCKKSGIPEQSMTFAIVIP